MLGVQVQVPACVADHIDGDAELAGTASQTRYSRVHNRSWDNTASMLLRSYRYHPEYSCSSDWCRFPRVGQPECQFYTKHMRCGFGASCKCASCHRAADLTIWSNCQPEHKPHLLCAAAVAS